MICPNGQDVPIRAVIFDIGGVLVRTEDWSGRRKWERHLNLPLNGLSTLVFDCEPAVHASIGQGSDAAIWQYVGQTCQLSSDSLSQLHEDFWSGDRLNRPLADYLRRLRPGVKTGILSNAWQEMRDLNVQRFELDNVVDVEVYSFQIGVLKPAPASYQYVLDRLQVEPHETVFIDDSERNIAGAQAVGLSAILFHSTQQVIAELEAVLVRS